ncbi:exopolyphosphatase [Lachnospiraceae bacterium OttesenSCG-928-D06]|nr:exopolyphosphatase [Lachnospiraceae bacterium OttesenSCG-928-D06]
MKLRTFAAIGVGSFEVAMKIFEFTGKNSIREIDHIRLRLDLGTDTYAYGKLGNDKLDELCRALSEFRQIMNSYKVEAYRAYATSAIRETTNTTIILAQIIQRTGIKLEVLSNSEQHFLDYKAVAGAGNVFRRIIEEKTAIVDIGGGSIQFSLFDKDALVSTQNIRLGVMRIQERLNHLNVRNAKLDTFIEEMLTVPLSSYKKLYLKDKEIKNIIIIDDYLSPWARRRAGRDSEKSVIYMKEYDSYLEQMRKKSLYDIAYHLDITEERAPLVYISMIVVHQIAQLMGAETIWAPGVTICDGIAYEYAEEKKLLAGEHNFEKDIIACAANISKRYMGSRKQTEFLANTSLSIFDSTKKLHGLSKRERLYLQIAALLYDCGKYISLINIGESSYNIIMATEMIGLSHQEREMVANIVRFVYGEFSYYGQWQERGTHLDRTAFLIVAKLTAILQLANSLNLSRKQKIKNVKITLRDHELIMTVEALEDLSLEKGLFHARTDFFQEVFSIQPVLRIKGRTDFPE